MSGRNANGKEDQSRPSRVRRRGLSFTDALSIASPTTERLSNVYRKLFRSPAVTKQGKVVPPRLGAKKKKNASASTVKRSEKSSLVVTHADNAEFNPDGSPIPEPMNPNTPENDVDELFRRQSLVFGLHGRNRSTILSSVKRAGSVASSLSNRMKDQVQLMLARSYSFAESKVPSTRSRAVRSAQQVSQQGKAASACQYSCNWLDHDPRFMSIFTPLKYAEIEVEDVIVVLKASNISSTKKNNKAKPKSGKKVVEISLGRIVLANMKTFEVGPFDRIGFNEICNVLLDKENKSLVIEAYPSLVDQAPNKGKKEKNKEILHDRVKTKYILKFPTEKSALEVARVIMRELANVAAAIDLGIEVAITELELHAKLHTGSDQKEDVSVSETEDYTSSPAHIYGNLFSENSVFIHHLECLYRKRVDIFTCIFKFGSEEISFAQEQLALLLDARVAHVDAPDMLRLDSEAEHWHRVAELGKRVRLGNTPPAPSINVLYGCMEESSDLKLDISGKSSSSIMTSGFGNDNDSEYGRFRIELEVQIDKKCLSVLTTEIERYLNPAMGRSLHSCRSFYLKNYLRKKEMETLVNEFADA